MVEITCNLISDCNLKCKFCYVINDHNKYSDKQLSNQLIEDNTKLIQSIISKVENDSVSIVLMGGELFQDKYLQQYSDQLLQMITKIKNDCNTNNNSLSISLMTNGIMKNVDLFYQLLKAIKQITDIEVHCSYDFVDRFPNQIVRDRWLANFFTIKSVVDNTFVSLTVTKRSIDYILKDSDQWKAIYDLGVFVSLYENTNTSIDQLFALSEDDVFNLLKHLYDNYRNEKWLQSLLSKQNYCLRSYFISNRHVSNCCNHKLIIKDNLRRFKCTLCNHNNVDCVHFCPRYSNQWINCVIKRFLDYVESKRNL